MRQVSNIFETKATRILRALLTNPAKEWTVRGLATEVDISPGYAHAVTSTLIQYGYITHTKNYKIKTTNHGLTAKMGSIPPIRQDEQVPRILHF